MIASRIVSVVNLPDEAAVPFGDRYIYVDPHGPDMLHTLREAQPRVLLCSANTIVLDAAMLAQLPDSIAAIATYSVGHEHIDLAAAEQRGLAVFNTPDVLTDAVADAAMLLLLGATRRATESIALVRSGTWTGWTPRQLNGWGLQGRCLGILGMGGIGRQVAKRAQAFGMEISYTNRRVASDAPDCTFVPDFFDLAAQSDALVLACPSTADTRGIVDARLLARARPHCVLVNIGRGNLVDDDALIAALEAGRIYAAGLDVFNNEPAFDRRYLALPNVFMLPHIGSSTLETRRAMAETLIQAIAAWEAGETPPNRLV
jgi:glyoxylate reductase